MCPERSITSVVGGDLRNDMSAKRQRDPVGLVGDARIVDVVRGREMDAVGDAVLPDVDADELHARRASVGVGLLKRRGLAAARRAPRRPEVQHDHLAGEAGEVEVVAGKVLAQRLAA